MNNKTLEEMLDDLFVSEASPPLTDAVVDAYLNSCDQYSPEDFKSMRSRFIEKSLADVYETPIKEIKEQISFGRWIKETRKKAHLTQEDISMSLARGTKYVDDIENGHIFPWQSEAENIAELIILFKLHFDALLALFHTSFAISKNQEKLKMAARSNKNENKTKAQDAIRKALEIHFSSKDEDLVLNDEVEKFLTSLKAELMEKKAFSLIS